MKKFKPEFSKNHGRNYYRSQTYRNINNKFFELELYTFSSLKMLHLLQQIS